MTKKMNELEADELFEGMDIAFDGYYDCKFSYVGVLGDYAIEAVFTVPHNEIHKVQFLPIEQLVIDDCSRFEVSIQNDVLFEINKEGE